MRSIFAILFSIFLLGPALAEWKISSYKDRLSDRTIKTATVIAKSADKGVTAKIEIFCAGYKEDTSPVVSIESSASFVPGRMGLRYRLDGEETEDRYMPVNSRGHGMDLWAQAKTFFEKKQLRVELQPYRSQNLFFDFEITGAERAIRSLNCKKLDSLD